MSVKNNLDSPQLKVWLLLHRNCSLITKAEDAVYATIDLTTQHQAVLLAMKYIRGPVTPGIIAQWLDRNTNSITTLVDRMEKVGLVRRVRNMRDRRSVRLVMTKKGKKALDEAEVLGWQLVQDILRIFSEKQLESLSELLQMVRNSTMDYISSKKQTNQ